MIRAGFGMYYNDLAQNGWVTAFQAVNGGGGTGSDRRTMASAAWSNAASPDPLAMLLESTCPIRSSAKLTKISALFCDRSAG